MSKWFKGNSRTHLAILAHVQEFLHNLSDLYKLSLFTNSGFLEAAGSCIPLYFFLHLKRSFGSRRRHGTPCR